jgi:O-antigen/teichoic acid export membrane protein
MTMSADPIERDDDETLLMPQGGTEGTMAAGTPAAPAAAPRGAGAGFASRLKRLGSETLVYGLSSIVGRFLAFLLQPFYSHEFTTAQNGVQSAVYTYAPVFLIVFVLGLDIGYMREAAAAAEQNDPEARRRAFTMSFGTNLAAGAVLLLLLGVAGAPVLAPVFRLPANAFLYLCAISYTDALLAVPYAHLRMTGRSMRYALLRLGFVLVSVAMNVVLIARLHWGVQAIFLSNLVANLVVLAVFVPMVVALFRPALLRNAPWKPLWKYALPIIPALLAVNIVENGDRMVLNWMPESLARAVYHMTSKDVVGIYSFNYKLGVAMLLVVQMFRMAWTPFSLQHGKQKDAPILFSRVLTLLMLVCAVSFLVLAFFLPPLSRIPRVYHYPREVTYWLGLPIVPVILLGYVFSGMYAVVTAGLYIERRTRVLPYIAGAGGVLNILICVVAARWSMVAVAWATPASYALMAALGAWQSNKVYPVPFEWGRIAHLGAIVAALFAVDQYLAHHGWNPIAGRTLLVKTVLLLALPVLLVATRFFRAGEWRAMRRLVPGARKPAAA